MQVSEQQAHLEDICRTVNLSACRAKAAQLNDLTLSDNFWSDTEKAQAALSELGALKADISELESYSDELDNARFALELVKVEVLRNLIILDYIMLPILLFLLHSIYQTL